MRNSNCSTVETEKEQETTKLKQVFSIKGRNAHVWNLVGLKKVVDHLQIH